MQLCAILQNFNEFKQKNLIRYIESISYYCDSLVVYDDASTDESVKFLELSQFYLKKGIKFNANEVKWGDQLKQIEIIRGETNDYKNEVKHKSLMLEKAREIGADWIFRIDADEIIEKRGEDGGIRNLCASPEFDSYSFNNINLWRDESFFRLDNAYNDFVSCRLWRLTDNVKYNNIKTGLHQRAVPDGLEKEKRSDLLTIHYGFASDDSILNKYYMYKSHGQNGWELDRLIDERTLTVARAKQDWFRWNINYKEPNQVFSIPLADKCKD